MTNYYEGIGEILKGISPILETTKNFSDMQAVTKITQSYAKIWGYQDISPIMHSMKAISENLQAISGIKYSDMYNMQRQMKRLAAYSGLMRNNWNIDMPQALKTLQAIPKADIEHISKILQEKFETTEITEETDLEEIVDEVAEQFVEEKTADKSEEKRTKPNALEIVQTIGKVADAVGEVAKTVQLIICLILYMMDFTPLSYPESKPTTSEIQNITIVNNFYKDDMGLDIEELTDFGYRIITESNVMPRIKPDTSSRVTGHLNIGQVVIIERKYRKWIEILWENEQGKYCSGWIQNYKVTEFK